MAPFEHFIFNFSKSCPFKGTRAGYVCLFWLDSSPSHWVHAESDSPSIESMWNETPCQLSQHGVRLHINWVNAEYANIYEEFIIPRWLSWHGISFRVDSVDVESLGIDSLMRNETLCQLSHRWMLKNSKKSVNSRTKLKNSVALLFGLHVFDKCKNEDKKFHASVPLSVFDNVP
jgi:hypothetical protein